MEKGRAGLANVRTRPDFVNWLRDNVKPHGEMTLEETADWFVAVSNARLILNSYTSKDVAHMLLTGVDGINKDPYIAHREFWNTFFEEADDARNTGDDADADDMEIDAVDNILDFLEHHFQGNLNLQ